MPGAAREADERHASWRGCHTEQPEAADGTGRVQRAAELRTGAHGDEAIASWSRNLAERVETPADNRASASQATTVLVASRDRHKRTECWCLRFAVGCLSP